LGARRYYNLLRRADVMVGNSSSGIWEAPSFQLPAVNIGDRQRGRTRAGNVIDVPVERNEIRRGVEKALSTDFRSSIRNIVNPYGDGHAAPRIVDILRTVPLGRELLMKRMK
jgi:UDP-N-acetylglucosamine 2-epimerase